MKKNPLLIAFLAVAIDLLGFGIVLPLLPLYAENLLGDVPKSLQGATIGLLMASFSAMQFLFAPGWGRLSDRIGRRPVLIVGLGGSVVFYSLFAIASYQQSLLWLFISRIGAGIAGATIGTAQAVIADSTPPERRARGMALIGMAFGVGFTLGPLIGTILVSEDNPLSPAPGFVAAGLSLAALVLAVFRLPETRPVGAEVQKRPWFNLDGWRLALGNPLTAFPLLTFFVVTLAFANFENTVARFNHDVLKLKISEQGYLFAYIGFVLMLVQGFVVRRLVTRVGEVPMIIVGIILMLAGLLVIGLLGTERVSIVLGPMALAVSGFAFVTPSAQALISRRSSIFRQGEILGVNQAASSIARILGPMMGNLLYGGTENMQPWLPYYAGAGLLAVSLLFALKLGRSDAGTPATADANV